MARKLKKSSAKKGNSKPAAKRATRARRAAPGAGEETTALSVLDGGMKSVIRNAFLRRPF